MIKKGEGSEFCRHEEAIKKRTLIEVAKKRPWRKNVERWVSEHLAKTEYD